MQRYRLLLFLLGFATAAWAQQQFTPRAGYVYPAGGQQGSSFDVMLGGQFLNGVKDVLISGEGVHASVIEFLKPVSNDEAKEMRDQLKELMTKWRETHPQQSSRPVTADSKAVWSDADENKAKELRMKLGQFQKRRVNPALAELVRVKVTIARDAEVGVHELRLETPQGVTTPLNFYVGTLTEWTKPAADTASAEEVNDQGFLKIRQDNPPPTAVVDVQTPLLINGQINAGGVDSYRFKVHKGEHLIAAASAREIIPYIADAVPGWFQASLTLYDDKGKELNYVDHYSFHPDPVMIYEVPEDGEYTLKIHDSIYRGREDFVYRIALGELPFVTGMFPLGGKAGTKTKVEFTGLNLAENKLTERSRSKERGTETLSLGEAEFTARPFALDTLPEVTVKNDHHSRGSAQKISLPVIANGRIAEKGAADYLQFKGKAGEEIEAEVYARRLDSPLDSILTLTDASGKLIASNDDFADESAGLLTDQADSRIRIKLPADGSYTLKITDTLLNGGPEYSYRLRVSHPIPDFELRVSPSSINTRPGLTVPITVTAIRYGGFSGDVAVRLKDAPHGFSLSGGTIPAGQTHVRMTLSMPPGRGAAGSSHLLLEGIAAIDGKEVRRKSVPSDDRMQAFFYHHLVVSRDLLVKVSGAQRQLPAWTTRTDHPITLIFGKVTLLRFSLPPMLAGKVKFELSEPPEGVTIDQTKPYPDGSTLLYLKADKAKVKAGLRGNLLLTATIDRPANAQGKGKQNTFTEMLPAFPFEVLTATPQAVQEAASLEPTSN